MLKVLLPLLALGALTLESGALTLVPPVTAPAVAASKSIVITAVPYTISRPGTYVLLGNLQLPNPYFILPAITIDAPGKVVLNLNNFTISGFFSVELAMVVKSDDVTIENGTILNFDDAFYINPYNDGTPPTSYLTGLKVLNVDFVNIYSVAISLYKVNGAKISDCSFSGGAEYFAIADSGSATGNSYSNESYNTSTGAPLYVASEVPLFLNEATFTQPSAAGIKP